MMQGEARERKVKALLYILHSLPRARDQEDRNGKTLHALRAERAMKVVVLL